MTITLAVIVGCYLIAAGIARIATPHVDRHMPPCASDRHGVRRVRARPYDWAGEGK